MTFEELKQILIGSVTTTADAGFREAAEALQWNRRKQARHPALIVHAATVADVQATVRYAAANGLRVSPRGGGHNFSGIAMQEGIVLDLGALDGLRIDAESLTAEVGPGVTNATLAAALEAEALSFPLGHCGSVPMSGYLLGGGLGWNSGTWGFACTRVESLDVVLADGTLRRVNATESPDIFWAARGGGPEFFGVVVNYGLRLEPMPEIVSAVRIYPLARATEVDRWMTDVLYAFPRNVDVTLEMKSVPVPGFDLPVPVAIAICVVYGADVVDAQRMHEAIAALAPAGAAEVIGPMPSPISALYRQTDATMPAGQRYAIDSFWVDEGTETVVARLAEAIAAAPSELCHSLVTRYPESRPALPDVAFSMSAPTWASACAIWDEAAKDGENIGWLRGAADAVGVASLGHYIGEADLEREGWLEDCYAPEALARLRALQRKYDPKGIFRRRADNLDTKLAEVA
jgi:FAD/FMN-containing dehydrogenase